MDGWHFKGLGMKTLLAVLLVLIFSVTVQAEPPKITLSRVGANFDVNAPIRFGQMLFNGPYDFASGRLDVSVTMTGYDGHDLFQRTFELRTTREEVMPNALNLPDWDVRFWWGFASSPSHPVEIPTMGIVARSTLYAQTRFIPFAYFTTAAGGDFIRGMSEFIDQYHLCDLPHDAFVYRQLQWNKTNQCVSENHRSAFFTLAICWGIGTPLCLFPPTALAGCPGLVVCNAANGACMIYRDVTTTFRWKDFETCLCTLVSNNVPNWNWCAFECPSCNPINPR